MTPNLTEQLWDDSPDALIAISPNGLVVRCNPAAQMMFGRPGKDLVGQPVHAILPSPQEPSDYKHLKQTLRDKDTALADAAQAQERIFIQLAHDLCNPLNSVIGFTGTLLMKLPGPLNTEQEEQLRIVQASARRMLTQIHALLHPAVGEEAAPSLKLKEE